MAPTVLRSVRSKAASEDMISQLPDELKDRILECLNTRNAARTALLSSQWREVWLRHGRLLFDWGFEKLGTVGSTRMAFGKMVSDILLLRSGPVKTFKLEYGPEPTQSDLEVWCRYLSRNGIEDLHLSFRTVGDERHEPKYKLPICLFSCPTIKHLSLGSFFIDFPANARLGSVFPCLTSLQLVDCVVSVHRANGTSPSCPNLEELVFQNCVHIENLLTSVPKLKLLGAWDQPVGIDWEWFKPRFLVVTSLFMTAKLLLENCVQIENLLTSDPKPNVLVVWDRRVGILWEWFTSLFLVVTTVGIEAKPLLFKNAGVAKPSFPTALNIEELWLHDFSFAVEAFTASIQLLKECPNLLTLGIVLEDEPSFMRARETISRMLENSSGWLNDHDLCRLENVEIRSFTGSRQEMLFVKAILSNTPALERLVIMESDDFDDAQALKLSRELLCFPRASPKAQVLFVDSNTMFGSRNSKEKRKENGVENKFSCLVRKENWKKKRMRRQNVPNGRKTKFLPFWRGK
ncbi:hypothetical protein DM860_000249 [Cuscuta australis]|uniref:F-box domain-containing protein n=1 Tax=Cuscuta australis TaxID=267555 RepID=A0A328CW55_9ASTE|nr:hypothetical protein DM860_000249 [Cuscuta australis]